MSISLGSREEKGEDPDFSLFKTQSSDELKKEIAIFHELD